jgi:hypothetical protein
MDGLFDQNARALFNAAQDEDDQAVITDARAPVETPVSEPSLDGRKRASRIAHLVLAITMGNGSDEQRTAMVPIEDDAAIDPLIRGLCRMSVLIPRGRSHAPQHV